MPINLNSYKAIQSNLFVKLVIDEYRTGTSGSYSSQTLLFSDRQGSYTIGSDTYVGLGNLMSISSSASELRVSEQEVTIGIAGIPNSAIAEIVNSKIKGSKVTIYRGIFNATTGSLLSISGNPMGRYRGYVNNYTLTEEYDVETKTSSNTILLICNSNIDVLSSKIAGRRTNPESEKKYFSSDLSMDRVPTLEDEYFDFGKKK